MKFIQLFFLASVVPLLAMASLEVEEEDELAFDAEFWQGMEAGFFLRNQPDGYLDY